MICDKSLYGNYRTRKFTDIWPDVASFIEDYKNVGIPATVDDTKINTLYYLLYARYGNSSIANSDETQFKYKVFSTIYQYGPTWARRSQIQDTLRSMDEKTILEGTRAINNHAYNPQQAPSTDTDEMLQYINEQATTKYKKSTLDGYALLWAVLRDDVTEIFLRHFREHFLTVVEPQIPLWYITEISGESIVDNDNGPNFAI